LSVDGKEVASQNIHSSVPSAFGLDESFDMGSDIATPEDDNDYQVQFESYSNFKSSKCFHVCKSNFQTVNY
jgi:hypothetical protein